jgi:hypothetical protein
MRLIAVIFLLACCLGACKESPLQDNADLESSISRLTRLLNEYEKIPVNKQNYSDRGLIFFKDQSQLRSFYEKYRNDISIMDNVFAINAKSTSIWSDDAAFSRGVLYCLLTQIASDDPVTQESALAVWGDFLQLGSAVHIEKSTKDALGVAFVTKLTLVFTPTLSYEENLQVIFHAYRVLSLIRIKEYQKAVQENEIVMKMYPTSKYTQEIAQDQIRAIKNLMEGKMTYPEALSERWQNHRVD